MKTTSLPLPPLHAAFRPVAATFALCCLAATLTATPFRVLDSYVEQSGYSADDDSFGAIDLGFSINLYGQTFSSLFVNNNGNVTFAWPSGVANPASVDGGLAEHGTPVLAPFLADVDTTYTNPVTFGTGQIDGRNAFVVNWSEVAPFGSGESPALLNSFQLFLVERADLGAGDFDFEFNYAGIGWDAGAAAGVAALVGFGDGTEGGDAFLLTGSGVFGAFLDAGPASTALIANQLGNPFDGDARDGRYAFGFRSGAAIISSLPGGGEGGNPGGPVSVPDAGEFPLLASSLALLAAASRRWRR